MHIKFHGVKIFVVFMAYLFPKKNNLPQLIFLPILPHCCIQCVITFSVNVNHNIRKDALSLLLGDHETRYENTLTATGNFILHLWSPHGGIKRLADCINVSWHMHGLLYFHEYNKLLCMVQQFCTVQQFATVLSFAWFPVPLPYICDT